MSVTCLLNDSSASLPSHLQAQSKTPTQSYRKSYVLECLVLCVCVDEVNVPGEFCRVDLDEGSDLRVLIPLRQGAGLCATALLSYLVSLHNQLVDAASQHTGENNRY